MNTKSKMRHLLIAASLGCAGQALAQADVVNHNGGTGYYLGWNASAPQALEVRHNGNYPIQWFTDSIQRMRLSPTVTTNMGPLDQYTNVQRNGYLLLSGEPNAFTNAACRAPFTRLHLVDSSGSTSPTVYAQQHGYRLWQRNGITFTGNSDQGYVGAKYLGNDTSDLVLQWSDNTEDAIYGTDRLRFLFTNRMDGATYGARSEEGLESFRVFVPNDTSAHVGIGDFHRAGLINGQNEDPSERLHVNDGTIRIDSLLPNYNNDTLSRVLMTDVNGRLHWRRLSTWPQTPGGGGGCDWDLDSPGMELATSWRPPGTNGSCPDRRWLIGMGTNSPSAKLHVLHDANERVADAGIRVNFTAASGPGSVFGIQSTIGGALSTATVAGGTGVLGELYRPTSTGTGVWGRVTANEPSAAMTNQAGIIGVAGTVGITAGSSAWSYGVKGEVTVDGGSGSHLHGGHFVSKVHDPSGSVVNSKGLFAESVVSAGTVANSYGLHAVARNALGSGNTTTSYGVFAESYSSTTLATSHGLFARGSGGTTNFGVRAFAQGAQSTTNYGIHATTNWQVNNVDWAGYFSGSVYSPYGTWQPSDAGLKSDVNDLSTNSAAEVLSSVQLHTFIYNRDQYPHMHLPEGEQVGVLAQELEAILPGSVRTAVEPAVYDEDGTLQHEAVEFKAVNYGSLIPYLVAAYQDERRNREELESRLDHLEQALAACCNNPDGARLLDQGLGQPSALDGSLNANEKLRIQPNPFNERTTVFYTLERGGRTQLIANSADGRDLRVLHEATLEQGNYQYEWNTADLVPGMYYVTLLRDGQPVVKKAVKVGR